MSRVTNHDRLFGYRLQLFDLAARLDGCGRVGSIFLTDSTFEPSSAGALAFAPLKFTRASGRWREAWVPGGESGC